MKKYSIPRQVWRAIYPVLIFFGLTFFVTYAAMFSYAVSLGVQAELGGAGMPDPYAMLEQSAEYALDNALSIQLVSNAIGILIFALMWRKIRTKLPKYEDSELAIPMIALTILGFAGFNYLMIAVLSPIDVARYFPSFEDHAMLFLSGSFVIRIACLCIAAPIVEELLCRGIIFNRLSAWMPAWVAALVSSALFAVMHFNLFQGLYAFVIGLALCTLYMRFRNLWIAIIAHVAFNLASVLLNEILVVTGNEEINLLLLLIPGLLLTVSCAVLMLKRTKPAVLIPEPEVEPDPAADGGYSKTGPTASATFAAELQNEHAE